MRCVFTLFFLLITRCVITQPFALEVLDLHPGQDHFYVLLTRSIDFGHVYEFFVKKVEIIRITFVLFFDTENDSCFALWVSYFANFREVFPVKALNFSNYKQLLLKIVERFKLESMFLVANLAICKSGYHAIYVTALHIAHYTANHNLRVNLLFEEEEHSHGNLRPISERRILFNF